MTSREPFALCPNGTLRLGYTAEAFPKVFFRNGRMIGYVADFWRTVKKELGCKRLRFIDYGYLSYTCHDNECLAMLDGAIMRNEVFTNVPSTYFSSYEVFDYRYSLPVFTSKWLLVEGRNITDGPEQDVSTVAQFAVYQTDAVITIFLLFLAIRIVEYLFRQFRKVDFPTQLSPSPLPFDLISASLIAFGMAVLLAVYQSAFKGNAATWEVEAAIPFARMLSEMQSGKKRVILEETASFTPEEVRQILTLFGKSSTIVADTAFRIRTACADPTVVTTVSDQQSLMLTTMKDLNGHCTLDRVALPHKNENPVPWLSLSMSGFDVFQIGMPRETPHQIVEKINEIALKLYSWDMCNGFWLRRYIPARSHYLIENLINAHNQPDSSFEVDLRPVSLARLSVPFAFAAISLSFSILAFLAEILIGLSKFGCRKKETH